MFQIVSGLAGRCWLNTKNQDQLSGASRATGMLTAAHATSAATAVVPHVRSRPARRHSRNRAPRSSSG